MFSLFFRFLITIAGLVGLLTEILGGTRRLAWHVPVIVLPVLSWVVWKAGKPCLRLQPSARLLEFMTCSVAVGGCVLYPAPAHFSLLLTLGVTWYLLELRDHRYIRSLGMLTVLLVTLLPAQFTQVEWFLTMMAEGVRRSAVKCLIWFGNLAYIDEWQLLAGSTRVDLLEPGLVWPVASLSIMFILLLSWHHGRSWLVLLMQMFCLCLWLSAGEFVRVMLLGWCADGVAGNGRLLLFVASIFAILIVFGLSVLTDVFLGFLTGPMRGYARFNRLFSGPKRIQNTDDSAASERQRDAARRKPSGRFKIFRAWWYTRTWWRAWSAVPLCLVAVSLITVLLKARTSLLVPGISAGISSDASGKSPVDFEIRLRTLVWLQPENLQWKWKLGQHLLRLGKVNDGADLIHAAAPRDAGGIPDARLWVATEQLKSLDWSSELSERTLNQLQQAVEESPENLLLYFRLGQTFERDGDLLLAEKNYRQSLAIPEAGLALAELLRRLQRPETEVQAAAESALRGLQVSSASERHADYSVWIAWSRALQLAGRGDEAMRVLQSAPSTVSHEPLMAAMNQLDIDESLRLLQLSPLNRRLACEKVMRVIARSPTDREALRLLVAIRRQGEVIPGDCLKASIAAIRGDAEPGQLSPLDLFLLGDMYEASGEYVLGADLLESVVSRYPNLVPMCVQLQRRSGRFQAAEAMLEATIQRCYEVLVANPADQRALMRLQECLSLCGRSREFDQSIVKARAASGQSDAAAAFLQSLLSQAYLADFDQLSSWSSRNDRPEIYADFEAVLAEADPQLRADLIELLMRCFQDPTAQDEAARRLVDLTLAEARIASDAQEILNDILSRGSTGGTLQGMLGTRYLQRGDWGRAVLLLNAARIHGNDQNPIVLNNLAVATLRSDIRNAGQALLHIDAALALQPQFPAFEATKGEVLVALKRWPEALELLERAVAAGFKEAATLELAAEAASAIGKTEQAAVYRDQIRLLNPGE